MIVNPGKLKPIVIQKSNQKTTLIENEVVEATSLIMLPEIYIDDQLSFKLHISNICKSASKQLNAVVRLKVLINSFILSNFNYGCLV